MSNSGGMFDGYLANIVDVLRKSENVEDEWNTLRLAEMWGQGKTKQLTKSVPLEYILNDSENEPEALGCTSPIWKRSVGSWEMYTGREKRLYSPKLGNGILQCARDQVSHKKGAW